MDNYNIDLVPSMNLETCQALLIDILSGKVKVKDGGVFPATPAGPRGPTAKVQPRLEACQALFLEMAGGPEGVTAKALLEAGNGAFVYTDVLLLARNLTESGLIQESRKGRKATWNLTTGE